MSALPSPEQIVADARLAADSHLARVLATEVHRAASLEVSPAPPRVVVPRFEAALRAAQVSSGGAIIAEFKRASPSLGPFAASRDFATQLAAYRDGGAACVSVLAEPSLFLGSVDDIRAAAAFGMPRLYKGFVLGEVHLDEAACCGADAVLLIARVLGAHTAAFAHAARTRGLEPLIELHDLAEVPFAETAEATLVGINARDLADFSLRTPECSALRAAFPQAVLIRESGLHTPADVRAAFAQGFDAVLIGEALMRSDDACAFLRGCRA